MLWRVRTMLPDRPGALAVLARTCGESGVNILGLQIFPGIEAVTDELVLRTPEHWGRAELAGLIEASGGTAVSAVPCTESALVDQPARYVQAARTILARPASFPEVVAQLFDAEADPVGGRLAAVQDVMDMTVGDVQVQVRRTAPFTATEHARGSAMADLVSDVLERGRAPDPVPSPARRLGAGLTPDYLVRGESVVALVEGSVVGIAELLPATDEGDTREATLRVEVEWQRRGIGTRLLLDVSRLAGGLGMRDILLTTRTENQAVLPMVLSAGLRGRIRMSSDVLTVRFPVHELKPLGI